MLFGLVFSNSRLYERIVHLKWSSKKMKHFLKRYLTFERQHGDEATAEHVKDLARAYVEAHGTGA